jgi:hypothetical protein
MSEKVLSQVLEVALTGVGIVAIFGIYQLAIAAL